MIAESVFAYFRVEKHLMEIQRLRSAGLQMSQAKKSQSLSDVLSGKTIVISGNFSISRDEVKSLIELNGGKNSGSISKKTNFLLAGLKPGPEKIKKANELGVEIIGEDDFMKMISHEYQSEPDLFSNLF